jgi:hypothetical protein
MTPPPVLSALLLFALLAAASPPIAAATDAPVDRSALARLLAGSGLLPEASRAQPRFVRHLVDAGVPDDGDRRLTTAILSTFPASQIRERWLRHLAEALDPAAWAAAADYWSSIPGRTVGEALVGASRRLDEDRRAALAADARPGAGASALTEALHGPTREGVLELHTRAMALWVAGRVAGDGPPDLDHARQRALDALAPPVRVDEALALADLPPLYRAQLLEWAGSPEGERFLRAHANALERALSEVASGHAGVIEAAVRARDAEREGRTLTVPESLDPSQ